VPSVIIAVASLGFAWWLIPHFWPTFLRGAAAGAIAGVLILGPGLRIAMRVVAIVDPVRRPEFTIEGTMFILVGIGVIFGGLFGAVTAPIQDAFDMDWRMAAVLPAALVMALILSADDLRAELFELGAGGWMNLPVFAGVALAYGLVATRIIHRLTTRRREPASALIDLPA
jgi:hypothetical protein